MKKRFIKTPLVGVQVHGAKDVGTRTVNLLMGEHAGEYVRGDIMDANAVIQAFDELKGNVDNNHDSLEEIVNEIHNFRDTTNHRFDVFQEKAEEETANRIQGDNTLDQKINAEKQERVNADTQLRNDLTAEVNRATTKESEIKAEVDIINGDSTTEGSFRKAIADIVGAAPEAYDTLKEIADKLNSNDDLHTTINEAIATKATTTALNEEITRAKAAEEENKTEIAAEVNRAKEAERIITSNVDNKADATALTALEEKVNANTADIDTKQPKGNYLTEHQSLEEYAKKAELPTKVSQLTNDSEFITKSVYDEKIAALEARIAALEAKHPETAA